MSAIWESANWTLQFGIRQTGNRQFGKLGGQKLSKMCKGTLATILTKQLYVFEIGK